MVFDLITIGRVSVDMYPEQIGVPLAEVRTFGKFLGGSPTNVAVATARYGHSAALITKVGEDGFGTYVRRALDGFNVDARWVGTDPDLRTPLVFPEIYPPDHFPLLFYREPKGPDMNLTLDDLDLEEIALARIFWTTGTRLADEPSRATTLAALRHRARSGITVHDLDYRAMLWQPDADVGGLQRQALAHATIAVGNLEECAMAVGDGSPEEMAARMLDLGVEIAIVKQGPAGVSVFSESGSETIAPLSVEVLNGLGAGDAFGGALCHGLLSGWEIGETVRFANAAGAYVATQLACADAMPDEATVRELLANA